MPEDAYTSGAVAVAHMAETMSATVCRRVKFMDRLVSSQRVFFKSKFREWM